jgi:glutamate--cysteine ligase
MAARGTASAPCPRFWVGLLYDQGALDAAWDLVKDWTMEEREALRNAVPKLGSTRLPGGGKLQGHCRAMLDISRAQALRRAGGSTAAATMKPASSIRCAKSQ